MHTPNLQKSVLYILVTMSLSIFSSSVFAEDQISRDEVVRKMKLAANVFRKNISRHGGYVYEQTVDGKIRYGEEDAGKDKIWVQPPGTPSAGLAYLDAYSVTNDAWYLEAATETGMALVNGQLKSGGWGHYIEFDLKSSDAMDYRRGVMNPKAKNYSTLDDNTSQSALLFLIKLDKAHQFKNETIHEAVTFGLKGLLDAQFPNGGFPQVWTKPVDKLPVKKASYPDYDPVTENRTKSYWNHYTLNDGLAGDVARVLIEADLTYGGKKYLDSMLKLGDFLILAQMPAPQPAWAQQYNEQMHPAWARKFEPPAITGSESQDVIRTLITISSFTGEKKYLEPVMPAIHYFRKSELPNQKLARFYELKTNKPLYFTKDYKLTYDDSDLPTHYSFIVGSDDLTRLEQDYLQVIKLNKPDKTVKIKKGSSKVPQILSSMNEKGYWLSKVKDSKFENYKDYVETEVFCRNIHELSAYLRK